MITYIDIENLRFFAPIGVMERERRVGNLFELSMRLYYDASQAMAGDDISSAVNYADVASAVTDALSQPVQLLEHAAAVARDVVTAKFPKVTSGRITIAKIHPPIASPTPRVSFTVEW
ncbi:MAG: dihydroneopterin aldolase [Odoribacter sp.]|nr:dihydroneopterin aldolase [Odoribacter sp.]